MSVETAFRRLKDVNPVPDPHALRGLRAETPDRRSPMLERSRTMHTEIDPHAETESRGRNTPRWLRGSARLAAAAAALIVAVVAGTVALTGGDAGTELVGNTVASPGSPTATETAREFLTAYAAQDAGAIGELLAPEAVANDVALPADTGNGAANIADGYARAFEWEQAVGWQTTPGECTQSDPGPPTVIRCSFRSENAWSRALEVAPISSLVDISVTGDGIIAVTDHFNRGAFDPLVWEPFRNWVEEHHPDDVRLMYGPDQHSPEALALWRAHTAQFVASITGPGS